MTPASRAGLSSALASGVRDHSSRNLRQSSADVVVTVVLDCMLVGVWRGLPCVSDSGAVEE